MAKLTSYKKKRNFKHTPEPKPIIRKSKNNNIFVIQQHHASHMHYDLRLEVNGVLKSWAIPKGPSLNPKEKRLATLTEDHPMDYASFEGIIPQGYGAGTVIVWDAGTYENITKKSSKKISMSRAFNNGHMKIILHGKKLNGAYTLTQFREKNWLFIKIKDDYASVKSNPVKTQPQSVLSKKTIKQLDKQYVKLSKTTSKKSLKVKHKENTVSIDNHAIALTNLNKPLFHHPTISKQKVIEYYHKIANFFIAHNKDHLLVMQRFPNGIYEEGFYQKQIADYFPSWIKRKTIPLKQGKKQTLVLVQDTASLVYLANQATLVFHSWLSTIHAIRKPDKLVFDLDPSKYEISTLHFVARQLKKIIESYQLTPFIMTTGSKGYHIVVPLIPRYTFISTYAFAKHIAYTLVKQHPEMCTLEMSKVKREGKIFIDYLRNLYGQTSVACYSLRALQNAPIATPITWKELSRTTPQKYNINNLFKRLARIRNPWSDFRKKEALLPKIKK